MKTKCENVSCLEMQQLVERQNLKYFRQFRRITPCSTGKCGSICAPQANANTREQPAVDQNNGQGGAQQEFFNHRADRAD